MKDINDDYDKNLEILNKEEEEIKKLLEMMNVKIELPNGVKNISNEKLQNISVLSIDSSQNSRKVSENKNDEEKKDDKKKDDSNNKKNEGKKDNNNSKVINSDKK